MIEGARRPRGTPEIYISTQVLCAGQTSVDGLFRELRKDAAFPVFAIGGAEHAGELDAKRAIDQGVRLATRIEDAAPGSVYGMPVGWQAGALEWLQRNVVKKGALLVYKCPHCSLYFPRVSMLRC